LVKEKVLVTGSEGFIGSHLVEELLKKGKKVKAFVLYNSFNSWGWLDQLPKTLAHEIEIISGDIRDSYCVEKAMEDCSEVFHLAALIAIPYSYRCPEMYIDTNIKGTLNVVRGARELGIEKVVHTSTSEVYGSAQYVPIDEQHPLVGQSPYSASKIGADQLALSYYLSFKTPVSIIRPFNTYGPRQSARAVIPTIITQILDGKKEITLGSLSPTRDFNYIKDTISGFVRVMESPNSLGEVINIGSGFEVAIGELALEIAKLIGQEIVIKEDMDRVRPKNSEVERLCANNNKAKELLDWMPRYGSLEGLRRGLAETIEWFSDKDNRKNYKSNIYNI